MNVPIDQRSAISGEEVERGLTCHPHRNPKGLCRRIGFPDYPGEKVINGNDGGSGKGADFCRRIVEIIQGRHIDGAAPDQPFFCDDPDKVNSPKRDHESGSFRIFQVNSLFSHILITVPCAGSADKCSGRNAHQPRPRTPGDEYCPGDRNQRHIGPVMENPP